MSADKTPVRGSRLPVVDPQQPVHPAHPSVNHMAVVVITLAVMLATALVATFLVLFGTVTGNAVVALALTLGACMTVLGFAELWFRGNRW